MCKHFQSLGIVAGLFAIAALTGCKSKGVGGEVRYMLPETKSIELTAEQRKMVSGNNDFALNLFRKTIETNDGGKSVFMSPMGVTFMLGMVQAGADNATQRQTADAMGFAGQGSQAVNEWCHAIQSQAPGMDEQVTFIDANAIYVNKQYDLQGDYRKVMREHYEAGVGSLDFASPKAAGTINKWSKDNTKGMIPKVIDETNGDAACYLLNAVYFDAKWTKQFDKEKTKDEAFATEDGARLTVPMMHNQAYVNCYADDDFTLVCLPYGSGTAWNMLVVLPAEGKTVADVAKLMGGRLQDAWQKSKAMQLDIKMPKFELQTHYDLKKTLPELGVKNIFSASRSGLTGICSANGVGTDVFVSEMFQDAALNVTEEGSKATAVTVAGVMRMSMHNPDAKPDVETGEFHANRPFLYFIVDNNTEAIFFAGTYTGK